MVSLMRTIRSFLRVGPRAWYRQMMYIGDAKSGRFVGEDQFGNKYYENLNPDEEVPGRHRWVDLAQHRFNATQVPPEWHSWISHIRHSPPHEDAVMIKSKPSWQSPWVESLTGTRGAYKSYNTAAPKMSAWTPKAIERG